MARRLLLVQVERALFASTFSMTFTRFSKHVSCQEWQLIPGARNFMCYTLEM